MIATPLAEEQRIDESFQPIEDMPEENAYFNAWLEQRYEQPAREERIVQADRLHDTKTVAEILSFRKVYIQKYAHAIPTSSALQAIAPFAPIIEVGAGTGYWASLLRQQGVDVLCYDKTPPGCADAANHFHEGATCWTEVLNGEDSVIDLHPDRTLLLCWPPPHDDMPFRALNRYRRDYFIYIGELPIDEDGSLHTAGTGRPTRNGVTITSRFFTELQQYWQPLQCVELPHWEICWDNLYVFARRPTPQNAGDLEQQDSQAPSTMYSVPTPAKELR